MIIVKATKDGETITGDTSYVANIIGCTDNNVRRSILNGHKCRGYEVECIERRMTSKKGRKNQILKEWDEMRKLFGK